MAVIPEDIIEEIRYRCDIVDVIGSYIQLKRAGGNSYKACCPFHNEKTPSFHVRGDKQAYHCFGCGKGGDVFRFVMDRENVTFPEAAHLLASRCGVVIPENTGDDAQSRERNNTRERLYSLNEEFARFFEYTLKKSPSGPAARYLAGRALPEDIVRQFRIGAAPDEWDGCLRYGRSIGFTDQEMLEGGIVRRHEETGRLYDHFKGRLTFAVWNEQGKVVGFSARTLEANPQTAKYVNTAETPVFKKSNLLYALPFARKPMQERQRAILCEGQLDTIALHRAGFAEAVAPQGTGFTQDQARILRRYADKVLLAFDADNAGQKAIRSAIEILLPLEFEIMVITIPGGKDPDELFKTGGAEAVAAAVNSAKPWTSHLIGGFSARFDMSTAAGLGRAISELVDLLMTVPGPVVRELYVREIAGQLRISKDNINAEINRRIQAARRRFSSRQNTSPSPEKKTAPRTSGASGEAMLTLLSVALSCENTARMLADELPDELPDADSVAARALNLVIGCAMNGEFAAAAGMVAALLADSPDERISRILVSGNVPDETLLGKTVKDCIGEIKSSRLRRSREDILNAMRNTSPQERMKLLAELSQM